MADYIKESASLDDDSNKLWFVCLFVFSFLFVIMKKMCKEKIKEGERGKERAPQGPLLELFVRTLLDHFFHNEGRRRCNWDVPKMKVYPWQIWHWACGWIVPFWSDTGKKQRYSTALEIALETHARNWLKCNEYNHQRKR